MAGLRGGDGEGGEQADPGKQRPASLRPPEWAQAAGNFPRHQPREPGADTSVGPALRPAPHSWSCAGEPLEEGGGQRASGQGRGLAKKRLVLLR